MAKRSRTGPAQRDGSDSDSDFPRQRDGWLLPPNKRKAPVKGVEMRASRIYRPPAISDMDYLDYGFGLESSDRSEGDDGPAAAPGPSGAPRAKEREETGGLLSDEDRGGHEWVDIHGAWFSFTRC
jgi:hypothetical protein